MGGITRCLDATITAQNPDKKRKQNINITEITFILLFIMHRDTVIDQLVHEQYCGLYPSGVSDPQSGEALINTAASSVGISLDLWKMIIWTLLY